MATAIPTTINISTGTIASQNADNINILGGTLSGIDLLYVSGQPGAYFSIGIPPEQGGPGFAFGWADTTVYHRLRSAGGADADVEFDLVNPLNHYLYINGGLKTFYNTHLAYTSGNVGIGTQSPLQKLDVFGTGLFRNDLLVNSLISGNSIIVASNVGIGTNNPATNLHISGDYNGIDGKIELDNMFDVSQAGSSVDFYHYNGSSKYKSVRLIGRRWNSSANFGEFVVQIGGNNSWSNDLITLNVNGIFSAPTIQAISTISAGTGSYGPIGFYGAASIPAGGTLKHGIWAIDHLDLNIRVAGTDYGYLSWNGNFGLGPASYFTSSNRPTSKLQVIGTSLLSGDTQINENLKVINNITGNSAIFSGSVGVGTNNPSNKLHVIGNVRIEGVLSGASALVLNSTGTNTVNSGQAGAYFNSTSGISSLTQFNLPSAVTGLGPYTFICSDASGVRVKASIGDIIRTGIGTLTTGGGYVQSTTMGSMLSLVSINQHVWQATSLIGQWS